MLLPGVKTFAGRPWCALPLTASFFFFFFIRICGRTWREFKKRKFQGTCFLPKLKKRQKEDCLMHTACPVRGNNSEGSVSPVEKMRRKRKRENWKEWNYSFEQHWGTKWMKTGRWSVVRQAGICFIKLLYYLFKTNSFLRMFFFVYPVIKYLQRGL